MMKGPSIHYRSGWRANVQATADRFAGGPPICRAQSAQPVCALPRVSTSLRRPPSAWARRTARTLQPPRCNRCMLGCARCHSRVLAARERSGGEAAQSLGGLHNGDALIAADGQQMPSVAETMRLARAATAAAMT